MTKTFEFYWNDLTKECQRKLFEFLGGENGNYDTFPFAHLEVEENDEEDDYTVCVSVEGYYIWSGRAADKQVAMKLALDAAGEQNFGDLENIDFSIVSAEKE